MLTGLLSSIDLFGSQYCFVMNRQSRISSWKGGLTSLIFIIGSLLYTIIFFNDCANHVYTTKNFKFSIQDFPNIDFSANNAFMFSYCLGSASNSSSFDPIISNAMNYSLNWVYSSKLPYLKTDKIKIPFQKCKIENFPKAVMNRYIFQEFQSCMCVQASSLTQNISNFLTDTYFSNFELEVRFNDTIISNKSLYNYFVNYLNINTPRGYFYFVDSVADIDNYINPFTYFLNFHVQLINPSIMVTSDLFLNKIGLTIDDQLIGRGNLIF